MKKHMCLFTVCVFCAFSWKDSEQNATWSANKHPLSYVCTDLGSRSAQNAQLRHMCRRTCSKTNVFWPLFHNHHSRPPPPVLRSNAKNPGQKSVKKSLPRQIATNSLLSLRIPLGLIWFIGMIPVTESLKKSPNRLLIYPGVCVFSLIYFLLVLGSWDFNHFHWFALYCLLFTAYIFWGGLTPVYQVCTAGNFT